jgi:hypothetical protein
MSELPKVRENNEQILNDIQSLQQMEQQLFSNLESNPNLSTQEQKKIIEKMNQLSNMRVNLYKTLRGVNNYFENALNTSIGSLKEQVIAIGIVENELNRAKTRLEVLEEEKNNKIRLVEINNYYGDKYAEHSQLMQLVIFILIPLIIITVLNKNGILPDMIYYTLLAIISAVGGYFFWIRVYYMWIRDNMNYQEYNWAFNPDDMEKDKNVSAPDTSDPWASYSLNIGTCIGDSCCSTGLVYDTKIDQCVKDTGTTAAATASKLPLAATAAASAAKLPLATTSTTATTKKTESFITESMLNRILTQKQQGKYKVDFNLKEPNPYNN